MTVPSTFATTNRPLFARGSRAVASKGILGTLLVFLVLCANLSAQDYVDLFNFAGTPGGCCPQYSSVMAQGRDGNMYGITTTGGTSNVGTIFKITPTGTLTLLHSFDTTHGATPIGGLTLGVDGNLYGTTEFGGTLGFGTIFKITPAGVLTVVYDFTGTTDGGYPVSALIIGTDGNFYGTSHPGILFKFTSTGVFTAVAKIPSESYGPLVQAKNGSFYGVTEFAGTNTLGTIYKVTGTTSTTLYNFDGPHGEFPIGGLVEGSDGNLYGTTTAGGGADDGEIFRITPNGTLTVMVNFDHVNQLMSGYQTFAGLIAGSDGNLYGATIFGGFYGDGVIFEMTTSGAYTVLTSFESTLGDGAYATPVEATSGSIFGLTTRGGAASDGVVYRFDGGLPPFAQLTTSAGLVGTTVGILGNGLSSVSSVEFNGTPATFHVLSNTYMTATIPSGETGFVSVVTSSRTLLSNKIFKVTPKMTAFSPPSGKVGDTITLSGTGFIQTTSITVGGVKVTSFTVNSDLQVTFRVPTGAKTGKIVLTTPGGNATGPGTFTVTH
jgi:uncharacterized repeat protein (TIGR03803 family)